MIKPPPHSFRKMDDFIRLSDVFFDAVTQVTQEFNCGRRVATLLLWEKSFKIGTDRSLWLDRAHARKFIETAV